MAEWIDYRYNQIIRVPIEGSSPQIIEESIKYNNGFFEEMGLGNNLILVDLTRSKLNFFELKKVFYMVKKLSKKCAFLGIKGLYKLLVCFLSCNCDTKTKCFQSESNAKEWLIS